ncbi:SDR family NAD(P)-dependent oxidoreductase [Allonocardiopsis opalescens]|uniref:Short-subunit dehydrogenase n=1 Tax=Allonocardiopsis opalescens TaxID=1144618 RepID=A0A2T0Q8D9_9ACTN|nr:SDR family NAD(P)-dependent oxidoreductase [Allonocardiopsis opalescens]PRY00077.1 short-subunit dehydrogenase [Allonocardiopsis opalescens]
MPAPAGRRSALVTGASSGIGRITALVLARRGWYVYAAVRRAEDARALDAALGARGRAVRLDLADGAAVAAVAAELAAAGPLHALVSVAGVAVPAPLEYADPADLRRQLEVNAVGPLALAAALLPALRAGRGRIVLVGSVAGRLALPVAGPYSASKAALAALADALRAELSGTGVAVSLVEPGVVDTGIWTSWRTAAAALSARLPAEARRRYGRALRARRPRLPGPEPALRPTAVVRVVLDALAAPRPRARYLVGADARLAAAASLLPAGARTRLARALSWLGAGTL